jgi:hypothetical protein
MRGSQQKQREFYLVNDNTTISDISTIQELSPLGAAAVAGQNPRERFIF